MPEGKVSDNLLLETILNLLKAIYNAEESSKENDVEKLRQNQHDDNNNDNNYNNKNDNIHDSNDNNNNNSNNHNYDNNDYTLSLKNTITAFLWITKAILQRKQIQNSEKTYSWQDSISSLLFTFLTNDKFNEIRYETFITQINNSLKSSKFPDISLILNSNIMRNGTLSYLISDKMNIITSKHTYVLLTQKINSINNHQFNNFNPFWQQKCWVQLAIPLLKKIIDYNQQNNANSNNNLKKIEFKEMNNESKIKYDKNKSENKKSNENENELYEMKEQRTFPTSCLLGLLHLSKNMPPNVLSSHSTELSKVVLEELKVTTEPSSVPGNVLLNTQGIEPSAGMCVSLFVYHDNSVFSMNYQLFPFFIIKLLIVDLC